MLYCLAKYGSLNVIMYYTHAGKYRQPSHKCRKNSVIKNHCKLYLPQKQLPENLAL